MEVNEQLVRAVTQAVVAQLMASGAQPQDAVSYTHLTLPTTPYV